jgi:small subunit ribosomal protein S14
MAKKSKVVQQQKLKKKSKYSTRVYNRCAVCGRPRGYIRKFGVCRICFRKLAHEGRITGVKKESW